MRTPQYKETNGTIFTFEQIGKTIKLCLATNPKEYLEEADEDDEEDTAIFLKHKGIKKDSKGMYGTEYKKRLHSFSQLKQHFASFAASTIVQTRLKKHLGDITMITMNKNGLSQLNDKVYYFENGLMSMPHNHPDLKRIVDYRAGKSVDELLNHEIETKTLEYEDEIILKTKHLRYYSSIMNHQMESGDTVKNIILSKL